MKKILFSFMLIFNFIHGEFSQYQSNLGLGVGLGLPTGYEFRGIYKQSEWLSLSLDYNIFSVEGINYGFNKDGMDLNVAGSLGFSTAGVLLHYHPFGGNLRASAGFFYDMGGLKIDTDGTIPFDTNGDGTTESVPVTGSISIKLGQTYPYLGLAYGYDFNSVVHLELSLGTYLMKRPQANLYFNVGDNNTIKGILTSAGIPVGYQDDIIAALEASGGNILNLPQIVTDQFGLSSSGLIMPNQKNLENDIVYLIQQGYSYLPEFLGYNLLPVISIGFTIFPF
ncbi:MAG: hypothetical protein KA299_04490 [Fusobacteriaceae bacterium]|nr:hypothetical protein [Fusobacteriaceae bacterium]